MVQSLFDLTSHAVRDAVVSGKISDASHLPLTLRIWILELFRMKKLMNNENVIRLLCQPAFLNGFTKIDTHETDGPSCRRDWSESLGCYTKFLPSLVQMFNANRRLAENITNLTLWISADCDASNGEHLIICPHVKDLGDLLSLCKNLKRLELVTHNSNMSDRLDAHLHNFSQMAVSAPVLKHLTLVDISDCFSLSQLPKRLFRSIRRLELHYMRFDQNTFSEILKCCQDTLTSLFIFDTCGDSQFTSAVPIGLPKLSYFSFDNDVPLPTVFEDIAKHCLNLTMARLKFEISTISEAELVALRQLVVRNRLRLCLTVKRRIPNFGDLVEIAGESIFGLDISESSLISTDFDRILSNCTNLCVLKGRFTSFESAAFLQNLVNDKVRASKLIDLKATCGSSETLLTPLFTNSYNLKRIDIFLRGRTDLDKYMQLWIDNGAQPTSITLRGYNLIHQNGVNSLAKACGRGLEYFAVTMDIAEASSCAWLPILSNYCPFLEVITFLYNDIPDEKPVDLNNRLQEIFFKSLNVDFRQESLYDPYRFPL